MIYVTQFDGWWSFTDRQWRQWLPTAIAGVKSGEGYLLPDANRLAHAPRSVAKEGPGSRWWYAVKKGVKVIQPLNWNLEQWEDELDETDQTQSGSTKTHQNQ